MKTFWPKNNLFCFSACVSTLHALFWLQLEAFYSIFTTEQQDHVKSVEYLRSNFRPVQSLDNRIVFKSAVKDAWMHDFADNSGRSYGAESSNGRTLLGNQETIHRLHCIDPMLGLRAVFI